MFGRHADSSVLLFSKPRKSFFPPLPLHLQEETIIADTIPLMLKLG